MNSANINERYSAVARLMLGLPLLLMFAGCGGNGGGGSAPIARTPYISGFSPQSGAPGTQVTISGSYFGATPVENTVKFNNVAASAIMSASPTEIVVNVPNGAVSGPISVTTTQGTAYSAGSFLVLPSAVAPPGPPVGLAAVAGNMQSTVSWSAVTGADSYNIYWGMTPGVTKLNGNKFTNTTSPYIHTGLTNGTTVFYVVTAVNSAGESAESFEVSATPTPTIPSVPSGVSAVPANGQNTITWNGSAGATSYNLYWATTPGVTKLTGTQIVGVSSTYVHSGLTNTQPYYYVVTALNAAGESAESAEVTATPVAPVVLPAAPDGVTAMAGNAQITLSWNPVAGAVSYNLYWSTAPGVTKAGTQIAAVTSPHVHSALTNGTTVYYVVTAVNANGESVESLQVSAIPTATLDSWTTGVSMPLSHVSPVTGVINGKLYVVGGSTGSGTLGTGATTALDVYDPVLNSWTTMAPAPSNRAAASGGVINGKLYVAGGCIGSDCRIGLVNTLEAYDPVTNTWATLAPMPTARFNPAAGVINGRLYLAGGGIACPPCGALNTVESYDPITNSWRAEPVMPMPLANTSGAVINNVLYVAGGYDWATGVSNAVLAFDSVANSWTVKASMPTPRQTAGGSASVNGMLYVIGGSGAMVVTDIVEAYDPLSNLWSSRTAMPVAKWGVGVGVLSGRIHVTGGVDGSNTFQTGMDIYQP